jgi:hypothetical protein
MTSTGGDRWRRCLYFHWSVNLYFYLGEALFASPSWFKYDNFLCTRGLTSTPALHFSYPRGISKATPNYNPGQLVSSSQPASVAIICTNPLLISLFSRKIMHFLRILKMCQMTDLVAVMWSSMCIPIGQLCGVWIALRRLMIKMLLSGSYLHKWNLSWPFS